MTSLEEPLVLRCGARVPNRVFLAPLTNKQSNEDGTLGEDELRFLERRAAGGFGLIETCASHVSIEGRGFDGQLGCFGDEHLAGLERLAGAVHARGALAVLQIFHAGLRALEKSTALSPATAREDEIDRVIERFADAAARARRAGLDGVEIHGAHGYLLCQLVSTVDNPRRDGWGGSLENRARALREVARRVRARTDARTIVGVRLSPQDFGNAKGIDLDEMIQIARWLADDGVDWVHLSLWKAHENTLKYPDKHAAELFRAALPREVPVLVAGEIWTPEEAASMLARGADAVALGRAAIANPDWPTRTREPAWSPRRPPLTPEELYERGVGEAFVRYLRNWKSFVG